jgi:hypothetical protein
MYGHAMYEIAKQRMADQQRAAQQARELREARAQRAAARGRHGRKETPETIAAPVIPDFAHEMFDVAREAVPAPRQDEAGGRRARSNR